MRLPYDGMSYRGWTLYLNRGLCTVEALAATREGFRFHKTDTLIIDLAEQNITPIAACLKLYEQLRIEVDRLIANGAPGTPDVLPQ